MKLIDGDALEHELISQRRYLNKDQVLDVAYIVNKAPAIDAMPVVTGSWESFDFGKTYRCTNCGFTTDFRLSNFCPECGAKMDGGNEDG